MGRFQGEIVAAVLMNHSRMTLSSVLLPGLVLAAVVCVSVYVCVCVCVIQIDGVCTLFPKHGAAVLGGDRRIHIHIPWKNVTKKSVGCKLGADCLVVRVLDSRWKASGFAPQCPQSCILEQDSPTCFFVTYLKRVTLSHF